MRHLNNILLISDTISGVSWVISARDGLQFSISRRVMAENIIVYLKCSVGNYSIAGKRGHWPASVTLP